MPELTWDFHFRKLHITAHQGGVRTLKVVIKVITHRHAVLWCSVCCIKCLTWSNTFSGELSSWYEELEARLISIRGVSGAVKVVGFVTLLIGVSDSCDCWLIWMEPGLLRCGNTPVPRDSIFYNFFFFFSYHSTTTITCTCSIFNRSFFALLLQHSLRSQDRHYYADGWSQLWKLIKCRARPTKCEFN